MGSSVAAGKNLVGYRQKCNCYQSDIPSTMEGEIDTSVLQFAVGHAKVTDHEIASVALQPPRVHCRNRNCRWLCCRAVRTCPAGLQRPLIRLVPVLDRR